MIYVHVPFCKRFCTYCDFYSEITEEGCFKAWADEACAEIRRRARDIGDDPKTLYFGGGTPSVLPLSVLTSLLITLDEVGHGGPYQEFTMEVNPEDIVEKGKGYVESLRALGVNRISIGVQSFDDPLLQWMNRRHDAARAREAFRIVREAGVDNVSIDLIFGISHLSDEVWADTVDQAVALGPEHISCYQLTVEGESALADQVAAGEYTEADDALCRRQYDILCQKLAEAGYHHYEISNFARPGFEAVHNGGYWDRRPYVGIGPGAHSFHGSTRSWNSKVLHGWTATTETLTPEDARVETLMLSLRTDKGIDAAFLHKNCRKEDIGRLVESGALVPVGNRYRIPEDRFFVSDEIVRELI
ncbi:MAG: radical SAM family heme chaperone HemW [Bacteroidales bacterium]|nr:radical SAM family heme chaperone HemW [Bacteroidales bacterium]